MRGRSTGFVKDHDRNSNVNDGSSPRKIDPLWSELSMSDGALLAVPTYDNGNIMRGGFAAE